MILSKSVTTDIFGFDVNFSIEVPRSGAQRLCVDSIPFRFDIQYDIGFLTDRIPSLEPSLILHELTDNAYGKQF